MNTTEEDLLQGYSEEEKERINELVGQLGISPDDPMFQIMATLGKYEAKVDEVLAAFDGMSAAWSIMLDSKLSGFSDATKATSQAWVNQAIREAMLDLPKAKGIASNINKGAISLQPMWAAAIVGGILALGAFIGSGIGFSAYSTIVGSGGSISPRLTPEEVKLVEWLKSDEGKLASEVVRKNMKEIESCQKHSSKLNGNCLINVK
ncbi:MAG: DUF6753 family protein [Cyanobacteria bacterium J06635_10]